MVNVDEFAISLRRAARRGQGRGVGGIGSRAVRAHQPASGKRPHDLCGTIAELEVILLVLQTISVPLLGATWRRITRHRLQRTSRRQRQSRSPLAQPLRRGNAKLRRPRLQISSVPLLGVTWRRITRNHLQLRSRWQRQRHPCTLGCIVGQTKSAGPHLTGHGGTRAAQAAAVRESRGAAS